MSKNIWISQDCSLLNLIANSVGCSALPCSIYLDSKAKMSLAHLGFKWEAATKPQDYWLDIEAFYIYIYF